MSTGLPSGRHAAASRPNYNRLSSSTTLWGHLLHKKPTTLASKSDLSQSQSTPPPAPVDKAGASARMLLHDTQATIEKFSARVDGLSAGVQDAKKEITTAHKVFQHGHEKLLEEQVNLVNRCQTQIQKSLGNPAQSLRVEELHEKVKSIDCKLEALDRRVDALHMLNQTQLQALQSVQEQQGTLIALIAPVSHLLDAVSLRIDGAKNEILDVARGASNACHDFRGDLAMLKEELHASVAAAFVKTSREAGRSPLRSPAAGSIASPSQPSPRKRRKIDEHALDLPLSSFCVSTTRDPRSSLESTATSAPTSSSPASSHSSSPERPRGSPDHSSIPRPHRCSSPEPAFAVSSGAPHHANEIAMNDDGSAHQARVWDEAATSRAPATRSSAVLAHAANDSSSPELTVDLALVSAILPTNSTSQTPVFKTSSALSRDQVLLQPHRPQSREATLSDLLLPRSEHNISLDDGRSTLPCSAFVGAKNSDVTFPGAATLSTLPQRSGIASSAGPARPMSLKDRRARGSLAGSFKRGARKRFILVDELDEEDEFGGEVL